MAGAPEGNKNATKQKRMITDALKRAVAQNPDKLKEACESVIQKAASGDLTAFSLLADRIDGKPAQTHGFDQDNPLQVALQGRIKIVRPNS